MLHNCEDLPYGTGIGVTHQEGAIINAAHCVVSAVLASPSELCEAARQTEAASEACTCTHIFDDCI